mmetsp:Transcript_168234/g.540493  ORF Transcript_168234/g.540493 Transcript_168234/m.540493 type:complete len:346 (-) Transcript_168234:317-1354(-)
MRALLTLLMVSPGAALEPFKVSLEWFWNPDHLPILVAQKHGYFAAHGLNVTVIEPDDHFEPVAVLTSGELDAAVTETVHLAQDRFKLGKDKLVGFNRFLHTLGGVMYARDGAGGHKPRLTITRPRDMCQPGKQLRIQYPGAPGKGGPAIVKTMVEFDGGNCDRTEIVPVNNGFFHTKALVEDQADVATLIFANFELPEAKNSNLDVGFFDLKKYGVPDFCQLVLIANPQALRSPATAWKFRSLNRALREATDWIKLNPANAKALWLEQFPTKDEAEARMMDEILDRTLYMFPHQQDLSEEYWVGMERWLKGTEQIDEVSVGKVDYWTNELAFESEETRKGGKEEL